MADKLSIGRILLIVDGTETGVRAARYAVRLAALHKAKVTALAVVDTAILKALLKSSVLVEAEMEEFDEELGGSAEKNLAYAAQLAKEAGVDADLLLKKGSAHAIVVDEARKLAPDMLVMGSFTTSMIKRDLNARARRLIVDEVKCPIVLVS
ncbi:MAG: universal stress protein [Planctomycetota bacterium]